ncbi:hypothetical protein AAHA92_00589 [Salvia divinorum]|uniref:Uncharacterized protein n=1 Tax=Salvia divinorum TaxID=28513 RepID=A0ABD1IK32_SALDI
MAAAIRVVPWRDMEVMAVETRYACKLSPLTYRPGPYDISKYRFKLSPISISTRRQIPDCHHNSRVTII